MAASRCSRDETGFPTVDGALSRLRRLCPAQLAPTDTKSFALTTAKALLTDYGAESPITRFDDDAAKNTKAWNDMPPVGDLQPLGKLKPGAVVLLDAKAGTRQVPLLVWEHYGRGTSLHACHGKHVALEDAPAS